jgi:hypothetical protein
MSKMLEFLIAEAQKYRMTDAERDEQVKSFAYGNTHFENETIRKTDIDRAMASLKERESTTLPERD